MVSWWSTSVAQATAAEFLGVVFFSWVFGVDSSRGESDRSMLGLSVLVGCVSMRIIVGK